MKWLQLAWANLWHTPLTSLVNAILMALGTASIVLLLLAGEQFARVVARDAQGIDLVLGAKGSPVQLVLSSVYHADIPTGNIPFADVARWADDRRVARAIPLSLGDSYRGFRIVGTTPQYADFYAANLAQGRFWQAPLQAVVGAAVARERHHREPAAAVALAGRIAPKMLRDRGQAHVAIHQGAAMGRASTLRLHLLGAAGRLEAVQLSGEVVAVSEGRWLRVPSGD